MAGNIPDSDAIDEALWVKVAENRKRFERDPTAENRASYERAFKAFTDWVLRRKMPDDQPETGGPK
jgi:hypothetical protein